MVSGAGKGRRGSARSAEAASAARKGDMSSIYEDLWASGNEDDVLPGQERLEGQGLQANGGSPWFTEMQVNGVPSASPMTFRKFDGLGQLKAIPSSPKVGVGMEMSQRSGKDAGNNSNDPIKEKKDDSVKMKKGNSVSYLKLYCFASPFDWLLMLFGTLGACAHGAAVPVFFIYFGRLIDSFGSNMNNPDKMASEVRKVHIFRLVPSFSLLYEPVGCMFLRQNECTFTKVMYRG